VRQYFAEADELWHEMHPEVASMRTNGDHVVVVGTCAFRGRGSELETRTPMAWLFTVRNGKILRYQGFSTPAEALAAAGIAD
jgi:ketosteroid isomerase-like protein